MALSSQRGDTTFFVLLGVIIIGAFFLAGGLGLGSPQSPTDSSINAQPIINAPDSSRNSLQLQTLKFKECSKQLTIDLLLDRSGSMGNQALSGGAKIDSLKRAVNTLTGNLSDDSIIGIQSFSSNPTGQRSCTAGISSYNLNSEVPISYYKDVKGTISGKVNALTPLGCTPTSESLSFAYDNIKAAQTKFPNRKFSLIFVTDGHPEPRTEDPRQFNPNPVEQLKNDGVNIYTIGVYGLTDVKDPTLEELLQYTASSPNNYFVTSAGNDLTKLLTNIAQKICSTGENN